MTEFLIHRFIKNWKSTEDLSVRTAYGVLASIVGILCNVLLFAAKLAAGIAVHSVSVMADAFNNLSDAGSSVISFVGVRMAGKPADEKHPFGHGRIEYISALIVAFLVIQVGLTFLQSSVQKIFSPEELAFQPVSVLILVLSVGVKFWLGRFNKNLGGRIDSKVMLASAADAMGDMITTSVTILSILVYHFFHLNIDGVVGTLVACLVIWSGIGIAKDTLEPLIGAPIDPKLYRSITERVDSYPGIVGCHDLIIHNYGPGRSMASLHAEVPQDTDIVESHELIDRIERELSKEFGIFLVIHMDPVETKDTHVLKVRGQIEELVRRVDARFSIHDFRMVNGKEQINLVFDLVVPQDFTPEEENEAGQRVMKEISLLDKRYQCVITIEKSFVAVE
ncbi:MAG TPA: cation transporter [Candidatus Limivivens intestinipullorum]|uniref:Cation transporter n=1 Tax=Candidatus Limivivens intestinipullorum TaxID=2840858 RepID=A0A9D1JJ13_9FIRM|nr:cation transporter [Candidatus Limivivens intestinipullorum]